MQLLSARNKNIITPLSAAAPSLSSTGSTGVASWAYSQDQSYHQWTHSKTNAGTFVWGVAGAAALLSTSQTRCEGTEDHAEEEPEIDPYDNLPEEDEPTHCSICLTYRQVGFNVTNLEQLLNPSQLRANVLIFCFLFSIFRSTFACNHKGPCRPYWRKVEACTKDGEKEKEKEEGEEDTGSEGEAAPDEPSTRCFKYMMPWIDCASKYRNLYTLIEMHTNYTEGIEELEATSRHFCWVPGKEPTIDWTNWEECEATEEFLAEAPSTDENTEPVPLWETFDPEQGDPKFLTVDAQVPVTINAGEGILECAYAVDQDNNVIGFAYGTKPSELMGDEKKSDDGEDETKSNDSDDEKETKGNLDKMVTLSIKLVEARTKGFTIAASYTHRIERTTKDESADNSPIGLESHLYKSKPFDLVDKPKPKKEHVTVFPATKKFFIGKE